MKNLQNNIVPKNYEGKQTELKYAVVADNREEAIQLFQKACERLRDVSAWHKICDIAGAEVSIIDENGNENQRLAQEGDYLQIDIVGPGSSAGDGYDWVKVELIEENSRPNGEEESMAMRLRPCDNPTKPGEETAHFFNEEATSTFIIERKGNTVTAAYFGRNEVPNTGSEKLIDKVRNVAISAFAMLGLSEVQWKSLIKGLLEGKEE